MKKTLVLLLIFLILIAGYFYFNKPQSIQFKGVSDLHLARVTDDASELRGDLVFHNPNKMRSQLGKLDFDVMMNGVKIGMLHDNFATAIKGDEDFHYSFQLRFPIADVIKSDTSGADLPVIITGSAGSDVLFANYNFAMDYSGNVKNSYR